MVINAKLFDKNYTLLGCGSETVKDRSVNVALKNQNLKSGSDTLTVVSITRDQQMLQQSFALPLSEAAGGGDCQFTYPENIKQYVSGTKVLQPNMAKCMSVIMARPAAGAPSTPQALTTTSRVLAAGAKMPRAKLALRLSLTSANT